MEEIWLNIKGYEGFYQVSNQGRVKSLDREVVYPDGHKQQYKGKILKTYIGTTGYLFVTLTVNSKAKRVRVHRLVAEAFIPNPENKPDIDHINTIRTDNRVENLRWATRSENMKNTLTRQKCSESRKGKYEGLDHNRAKSIVCLFPTGVVTGIMCISEMADFLGIDRGTIRRLMKKGTSYSGRIVKLKGIKIIKID